MARETEEITWLDHREMGVKVDLGGTSQPFALRRFGEGTYQVDIAGWSLETFDDPDILFRATYPDSMADYDLDGNLTRVELRLGAMVVNVSDELLDGLSEEFLLVSGYMYEDEADLMMEIDLKDGLEAGDNRGWLQFVSGDSFGLDTNGAGGFEFADNEGVTVQRVGVLDSDGEEVGSVLVGVKSEAGWLSVFVGDEENMVLAQYRRFVHAEKIKLDVNSPRQVWQFLQSLRTPSVGGGR